MLQIVFLTLLFAVGQSSAKHHSPVEVQHEGTLELMWQNGARMGMELGQNKHGIGAE